MDFLLEELKEKTKRVFYDDLFDSRSGVKKITAPMPDYEKFIIERGELMKEHAEAHNELKSLYGEPLLNNEQEYHLFRELNYYKYRVQKSSRLAFAEKYFSEYERVKKQIASSNVRLVANIAKKQRDYVQSHSMEVLIELLGDGNVGLMRAVDYFDFRRGFKFSTYATWAIRDSINRARGQRIKHCVAYSNSDSSVFLEKEDESQNDLELLKNRQLVDYLLEKVSPKQRYVLNEIYRKGRRLKDVAADPNLRISKERVRQIKESALKKIREHAKQVNYDSTHIS